MEFLEVSLSQEFLHGIRSQVPAICFNCPQHLPSQPEGHPSFSCANAARDVVHFAKAADAALMPPPATSGAKSNRSSEKEQEHNR